MKDYEKPILVHNDAAFEGVYAASGADCYDVTPRIHQRPETGRGDYRIQVDGVHSATDGHHSGEQILTLYFNQPVTYVSSGGTLKGGDGTAALSITYNYHNNASDNIGLGDVIVTSDAGLSIPGGAKLECNHDCGQH